MLPSGMVSTSGVSAARARSPPLCFTFTSHRLRLLKMVGNLRVLSAMAAARFRSHFTRARSISEPLRL